MSVTCFTLLTGRARGCRPKRLRARFSTSAAVSDLYRRPSTLHTPENRENPYLVVCTGESAEFVRGVTACAGGLNLKEKENERRHFCARAIHVNNGIGSVEFSFGNVGALPKGQLPRPRQTKKNNIERALLLLRITCITKHYFTF